MGEAAEALRGIGETTELRERAAAMAEEAERSGSAARPGGLRAAQRV